jgi:hypothetical protein
MSDSAATGGDPATVDAMAHQTVRNDAVADAPVYNTDDASSLAGREAEVAEEQNLDERHATGEHYTGGRRGVEEDDPLLDLDHPVDAPVEDPETNLGRGVDNI